MYVLEKTSELRILHHREVTSIAEESDSLNDGKARRPHEQMQKCVSETSACTLEVALGRGVDNPSRKA